MTIPLYLCAASGLRYNQLILKQLEEEYFSFQFHSLKSDLYINIKDGPEVSYFTIQLKTVGCLEIHEANFI
jgi:hypothetical protein